jgi:SPX domain protein involved in polyphosphate accumulation
VRNSQAVEVKRHITKHLPPVPVFFNEPAIDPADGWVEGTPTAGKRTVAIRSVLYSDGSAKRWYRMQEAKPQNRKKRRVVARRQKEKK